LAEDIAPGHQAAIFTHADKEHLHNHIVINAVNLESGRKYNDGKDNLEYIRNASDRLCLERGLNIVKEHTQRERLTMAERQMRERGQSPWKDELRNAIDKAKEHSKSLDDMKDYLQKHYGVEMKIQDKNVSFLHPEKEKFCRGKTLGEDYTKETLTRELGKDRNKEQQQEQSVQKREVPQQSQQLYPGHSDQQYQKGLSALRGLSQAQTGQQDMRTPERSKTPQKHRNRRAQSRIQQQQRGPEPER